MKKRQKPILLITILVVAFLGAIFVNYLTSRAENPQEQAREKAISQMEQQKALADPRKGSANQQGLANDVAASLEGKGKRSGPKPAEAPAATKNPGPAPTLIMPKPAKMSKPTPNDTDVASQWYTTNSVHSK